MDWRVPVPEPMEHLISSCVPSRQTAVPLLTIKFSIVIVPLAARSENAPVDLVVAPIAVLFIPVAVVLKLLDVNVNAFAPVFIEEALSPERLTVPLVAVRFNAPVV